MSQDECSFVSLRDVERAMIVFKFFTEKMSLFTEHIARKAAAEVTDVRKPHHSGLLLSDNISPNLSSCRMAPRLHCRMPPHGHLCCLSVSVIMQDCRIEKSLRKEWCSSSHRH